MMNRRVLSDTSPCKGEVDPRSGSGGGPASQQAPNPRRGGTPTRRLSAPPSPLQGEGFGTAVPNNKIHMQSPYNLPEGA